MERVSTKKGIILFYIISMLLTYLLIIRVDSVSSIANIDTTSVYLETNV